MVCPLAILSWRRTLVAHKWDYFHRKTKPPCVPRIRQVIVDLVLSFASENPSSGYDRIQAALAKVGYDISDTTVGKVLKQHGTEPAPDRKRKATWKTFIKSHWDVLSSTLECCIALPNDAMLLEIQGFAGPGIAQRPVFLFVGVRSTSLSAALPSRSLRQNIQGPSLWRCP